MRIVISCLFIVISLSAMEQRPKYNITLSTIIREEIESREGTIKAWPDILKIIDIDAVEQERIQTHMKFLQYEIIFLNNLQLSSSIELQKVYCLGVISKRIDILKYELQFKHQFQDRNLLHSVNKLTKGDIENRQKELRKALKLQEEIKAINTEIKSWIPFVGDLMNKDKDDD